MVGRGLVVVEERRVGQVRGRVPRRLDVALRLLERHPGVGVAGHHLRTAVAQRTVVVALGGRKSLRTTPLSDCRWKSAGRAHVTSAGVSFRVVARTRLTALASCLA